jgi:hypothetical protein
MHVELWQPTEGDGCSKSDLIDEQPLAVHDDQATR